MKIIISFGILFLFFQEIVFSQNNTFQSNSDSLTPKSKYLYQLLNDSKYKEFNNYDMETMGTYERLFSIDSLKYVYELLMLNNFIRNSLNSNINNTKLLDHKKSHELILLTWKNYYESQPNYDLGIVGKYLGISKKVFALILAVISL